MGDAPGGAAAYRQQDVRTLPRLVAIATGPAADVAFAVALTGLNLAALRPLADGGPVALAVAVAETAPAVLWRRRPLIALSVTAVAALIGVALAMPPAAAGFVAILFSLGAVAHVYGPRVSVPAALAIVAGTVVVVRASDLVNIGFQVALVGAAWSFGSGVRTRLALTSALAELMASTEHARAEEAGRAAADERGRLAREVHDIVAHSLSVMVVQAGAARSVAGDSPEEVRTALGEIERTGREALGEIRRLLGAVRSGGSDDGEDGRSPQPGLAALPTLLERFRGLGLAVEAERESGLATLPTTIDLSAYRIVQEALTNCLRHARGAPARVVLARERDELLVEITNGPGRPSPAAPPGIGHGLSGMRERVAVYGGAFEAGPLPAGGWRVRARLPLDRAR
jgi:signal transduction histidine kinase